MHELFWYGLICGVALGIFLYQAARACLQSRLKANQWMWRPGRYFRFKKARIVDTGVSAMYACGGQIVADPYIRGWRIVVPVTLDPLRILGDLSDERWMLHHLPDDVLPVSDIELCTRQEYHRLDCDLQSCQVYMRPPPRDEENDEIETHRSPTPRN